MPHRYTAVSFQARSPEKLGQREGVALCERYGMEMAIFFWQGGHGGTGDFTGDRHCRDFVGSRIEQALQVYQSTGSFLPDAGKILWLPDRRRAWIPPAIRLLLNAKQVR